MGGPELLDRPGRVPDLAALLRGLDELGVKGFVPFL
jgi:hypothetical protein